MAGGRGVDHGPQINNCVTFVVLKVKNPAYGRHWIFWLMRIVSTIEKRTEMAFFFGGGSQILKKIEGGGSKNYQKHMVFIFFVIIFSFSG